MAVLAQKVLLDACDHYWAEVGLVLCLRVNSVIFYCVVSGYICAKFHLRLVINEIPKKWWSVENDKHEDRDLCKCEFTHR